MRRPGSSRRAAKQAPSVAGRHAWTAASDCSPDSRELAEAEARTILPGELKSNALAASMECRSDLLQAVRLREPYGMIILIAALLILPVLGAQRNPRLGLAQSLNQGSHLAHVLSQRPPSGDHLGVAAAGGGGAGRAAAGGGGAGRAAAGGGGAGRAAAGGGGASTRPCSASMMQ
jgi:hypothetical protein